MSGLSAPFVETREIRIAILIVYVRQTSNSMSVCRARWNPQIHQHAQKSSITNESDVGHEATVVVIMGAGGDRVRRHLAVHVEISESRPGGNKTKKTNSFSITPQNLHLSQFLIQNGKRQAMSFDRQLKQGLLSGTFFVRFMSTCK